MNGVIGSESLNKCYSNVRESSLAGDKRELPLWLHESSIDTLEASLDGFWRRLSGLPKSSLENVPARVIGTGEPKSGRRRS